MTVDEWFAAHDAYHKASARYNSRLLVVRAERERGNWSMDVNEEYADLTVAQRAALNADSKLYAAMVATSQDRPPMTDRPSPSDEQNCIIRSVWCEQSAAECFAPECLAHGCFADKLPTFGGADYCEQCHGPCLRRPRHGEFNI